MASFKALLALCAILALAPLARAQTCSATQGEWHAPGPVGQGSFDLFRD
jgi:hypothetical protein